MATIEQRIYDGNRAREVLENEAFAAAFADIKQELTEQWAQSPARDQEGREKLYQLLKLADKLESTLRNSLETGKLAKAELQHQQTLAQRAKTWIGST
jgi:hypothetical protein